MFFTSFAILLLAVHIGALPGDFDMQFFWRRSNSEKCIPFTTFVVDCNQCVCAAEGVPYCTRLKCPKKGENKLQNNVEGGEKISAATLIGKEDMSNYRAQPRVL